MSDIKTKEDTGVAVQPPPGTPSSHISTSSHPNLGSGLLALAWPSPACCGHVENSISITSTVLLISKRPRKPIRGRGVRRQQPHPLRKHWSEGRKAAVTKVLKMELHSVMACGGQARRKPTERRQRKMLTGGSLPLLSHSVLGLCFSFLKGKITTIKWFDFVFNEQNIIEFRHSYKNNGGSKLTTGVLLKMTKPLSVEKCTEGIVKL